MHHRLPFVASALLALALTPSIPAHDHPAGPYEGLAAVRVTARDGVDLARIEALGGRLLSCQERIGETDYLIPNELLPRLRQAGLSHRVLAADVAAAVAAHRDEVDQLRAMDAGDWYATFRTLDEIEDRLAMLAASSPAATMIEVGTSLEGRTIHGLRIAGGDATDRPGILFNGCQHAREWISPMTTMHVAESLVLGYGSDVELTELLDRVEVFVVPVVNPDGYLFSWSDQRLWRKNRRLNGDGTHGVDLNRNWGFGWGGGGSSGDPDNDTYRGTEPFSEPETQALSALYAAQPNIVASIDFHAFGQLVLYPWAVEGGGPGDDGEHAHAASLMEDAIESVHDMNYVAGPVFDTLYQASGGSVDWTWGERGVLSYTIELRDTGANGFLLPPDQIVPTCEENWPAARRLVELVGGSGHFAFPAGRPALVEADEPTLLSVELLVLGDGTPEVRLFARTRKLGAFVEFAGVPTGGLGVAVTLPAMPCGSVLEYYLEADAPDGSVVRAPANAPAELFVADVLETTMIFADDFEIAAGWTVESENLTDGAWDVGVPVGGGDRGDPPFDGDGSGACALTDNVDGNSDVDGGPTRIISPGFDASGFDAPILEFHAWMANDDGDGDRLVAALSNDDGLTWTDALALPDTGGWVRTTVAIADHLAPTATMRVRFSVADVPNDSVTEAGVDGLRIYEASCPPRSTADLDGDGVVGFGDLIVLLGAWGDCAGAPCAADLDGDGVVGLGDLIALLADWSA